MCATHSDIAENCSSKPYSPALAWRGSSCRHVFNTLCNTEIL